MVDKKLSERKKTKKWKNEICHQKWKKCKKPFKDSQHLVGITAVSYYCVNLYYKPNIKNKSREQQHQSVQESGK